ncbi:MAG: putative glycoside hydrolase [Terriglobales bacterium]
MATAPPRAQDARVQVAYFYKPPLDGTPARVLAHHAQLIILTQNDEAYAARLRRDGYRGAILQYVNGGEVEGPGPYFRRPRQCDRDYRPYQYSLADRRGVFCGEINPHERWFLHGPTGRRILNTYRSGDGVMRTNYAMNPAAPGWRRFAAGHLSSYRRLGYDGLFLDNIALGRAGLEHEEHGPKGVREFASDAAWRRAMAGFLAAVRRAVGSAPLWANLTHDSGGAHSWRRYLPYLNGLMVEDFLFGWRGYPLAPAGRESQWAQIRAALQAGHSVLLVAQGGRWDRARLRLALAGYWLLAPPPGKSRLYFRYGDAQDLAYRAWWWYAAYDRSPGRPLGPARHRGTCWWRPFAASVIRLQLVPLRTERCSRPPRDSAAGRCRLVALRSRRRIRARPFHPSTRLAAERPGSTAGSPAPWDPRAEMAKAAGRDARRRR